MAATLLRDRGGDRAAEGLSATTRERWLAAAKALQASPQRARARALASWTRPPADTEVPHRRGTLSVNRRALDLLQGRGRATADRPSPPAALVQYLARRLRALDPADVTSGPKGEG